MKSSKGITVASWLWFFVSTTSKSSVGADRLGIDLDRDNLTNNDGDDDKAGNATTSSSGGDHQDPALDNSRSNLSIAAILTLVALVLSMILAVFVYVRYCTPNAEGDDDGETVCSRKSSDPLDRPHDDEHHNDPTTNDPDALDTESLSTPHH